MAQRLFCIYARAANGVIGKDGALPWHIPADLRRFRALTMGPENRGLPMIMGRRTFESFPRPLPGRRHIVLTRSRDWAPEGAEIVHSVDQALATAGTGEIAVIGGAAIYAEFLPLCRRVDLTQVHADYHGDTVMPPLGPEWQEVARENHAAAGGLPAYSFITLEKSA